MSLLSLETYRKNRLVYHAVMWAGLALWFVCGTFRQCNLTKRVNIAEEAYRQQVVATEVLQKKSDAIIAVLTASSQAALERADGLAVENSTLKAKVAAQAGTIADLQAAEPPTTPELEALPLVISLRAQNRALLEGFTLAQQTIAQQDEEIKALRLVIVDQRLIIAEWEAKFNREQALRLSSERLSATYKRELTKFRLTGTVKTVVIGGLAAGLVYSMVK